MTRCREPKVPRVSEKRVQASIVQALRTVGATVYVLGTVHAGESGRMTTRMTPGLPDLLVFLPHSPIDGYGQQVWIEVKAKGGRLSEAQKDFRDRCQRAAIPHLVGDLDDVLAYLQQQGYVKVGAHSQRATQIGPCGPSTEGNPCPPHGPSVFTPSMKGPA